MTDTSTQSIPKGTTNPSPTSDTEQRAKLFAALSDPTRLRIVELLATQGELSGSEIATQVGISLALFCHHSKTLAEAGLLQIRREGQTKYNSLNQDLLLSCFSAFEGLCQAGRQEG
ncbi:transcriptional regulator [filamentous cyanobacterium CCP1]|nr:transcriptional regulator [filamentous cyanobacterium CCP2]PSB66827.1 transcriptional regulator [filamentous cyanobacterium CCP1]